MNADGTGPHSLGMASEPDVANDGTLFLRYSGGDVCHGKYNRQLYVELICPRDGAGLAIWGVMDPPQFLSETSDCEYRFSWRTSAACPVGEAIPPVGEFCRITDNEGNTYDLSSLSQDFDVVESPFTYKVHICGDVSEGGQCASSGACQVGDGNVLKGMGRVTPLQSTPSGLRLEYLNGTLCHDAAYQRSTVIEFQCNEAVTANPVLKFVTEHANCSYTFFMETALACPRDVTPMTCAYVITPAPPSAYSAHPLSPGVLDCAMERRGLPCPV
jgi:insulin-like growth factor 2 receptor